MSDSTPLPPAQTIVPRLTKAVGCLLFAGAVILGVWQGVRYTRLHLALRHAHEDSPPGDICAPSSGRAAR
ncbi:hypothetical protein CfE428DRAFT_2771 [Chthoniobacter flavus Ellin428]|uniref:Uncharacterized protein n=1 Tax=Chthoniobacter flavus Ellin428 TaxID=497964 RepID=B4D1I3_9BACT|nr:hypothetical protein [Chthoniobacter flavus]EDY19595.1 hypothetical protein CfE428DRAFT_2771 [Chthoniobacter flavus Ellin428]